jgi:DNA-binding response OmpR family regulator
MRKLIFLIEDEADIARLVRHHLEQAGYGVRVFYNTTEVVREAEELRPALFLLDIMVPGGDGLDLCRRIRQNARIGATPVIFLTARVAESDRILGLELGADDYITKPFSPRELLARIKAVLRRFERPLAPTVTKVGEVEIDSGAMTLAVGGKPVTTTATEFRLLDCLARHPGRVFTRDQLLDAVWRDTQFVTPRSVDVYVRRLREKIEPDPENPRYLRTRAGRWLPFRSAQARSTSGSCQQLKLTRRSCLFIPMSA